MLALAGKPMYFLELAVGQFGGVGPIGLWNCCPIAKGKLLMIIGTLCGQGNLLVGKKSKKLQFSVMKFSGPYLIS